MRHLSFLIVLLLLAGFASVAIVQAQSGRSIAVAKRTVPYTFDNFVWWSGDDLRTEVRKRLPGLGEKVALGSPALSQIRLVLVELLKAKGISAMVQVLTPSVDTLSAKRDPGVPPPSIVYSILSPPNIVVEGVSVENAPTESSGALRSIFTRMAGMPYRESSLWFYREKIKEEMQQLGYLSSVVTLDHGAPRKDGDRYLVPLVAGVTIGPKFHVASVKADGGPLAQGRDLSPFFQLKSGDVATTDAFGKLVGALRTTYQRAGYPDVEFTDAPTLDVSHALASYSLRVIPGPLYHVRGVKFRTSTQLWSRRLGRYLVCELEMSMMS